MCLSLCTFKSFFIAFFHLSITHACVSLQNENFVVEAKNKFKERQKTVIIRVPRAFDRSIHRLNR